MATLLVLNAGSSSVKFAAFESGTASGDMLPLQRGHVALVDSGIELLVRDSDGKVLEQSHAASSDGRLDHGQAMASLFGWLDSHSGRMQPAAVGHRVVHGGQNFARPVGVTDAVLGELEALVPLAPLHQPHSLQAIRLVRDRWPGVPQVACFDTAFHHTQAMLARAFALPRALAQAGVRRYGFHGLSYEYVATQLPHVLGESAARGKIIVAHLGNGASLCAMVDGRSVATTMGFSVLDGLVMGTRCGNLDAGVVLYLLQERGMTAQEVSKLLYSQSGLLGVSGLSSDMDVLLHSADPRAGEAVDLFVYRLVCEIGALAAAMGGLDALVFTAGIGENAATIRARVCAGCEWLGAAMDESANGIDLELIHQPASRLQLAIVPTDEELMIALHTQGCLPLPA